MLLANTSDTTPAPVTGRRRLGAGLLATVIGAGITAGAAASVADLVPVDLDAELIALCAHYVNRVRDERAAVESMPDEPRLKLYAQAAASAIRGERSWDDIMVGRIAAVPAHSPAGQAAKARALVWYYGGNDDRDPFGWRAEDALLASLVADVTGRASA